MAQQVRVLLIDDLDGNRGGGAVRVGLDGTGYEIGLIAGYARAAPDTLARYVAAARRAGGGRRPARADAGHR